MIPAEQSHAAVNPKDEAGVDSFSIHFQLWHRDQMKPVSSHQALDLTLLISVTHTQELHVHSGFASFPTHDVITKQFV